MPAPKIIDTALLRQRRLHSLQTGDWQRADFLLEWAVADVAERLGAVQRQFDTGLIIGLPRGMGADLLAASGKVATVVEADLALEATAENQQMGVTLSEEAFPFKDQSLDLIVSVLSLHLVNDLPGALVQMRRALKPDGLFMALMVGGQSLDALRNALLEAEIELRGGTTPRLIPMADVRDLGALLQRAGFALPVSDVDRLTVRYQNPLRLFEDLKLMGAQNPLHARDKKLFSPALMALTLARLEHTRDQDGKIAIQFELISLSGWAPHESQQKPLKPGSAKMSLKDVLQKGPQPKP